VALIECPDCRHEVSDKAPACPKCGHPVAPPSLQPRVIKETTVVEKNNGCGQFLVIMFAVVAAALMLAFM